jgi:hypothetical protein
MLGLFVIASGQFLLLLLVFYFTAFSVIERLATDAVWRRAGPLPAAIYDAILAGWFIAVVFPLS